MAAALDLGPAVSYSLAAVELASKGRFASASEKFALAAKAALALGAPDCLVVATAQARYPHCIASRASRRSRASSHAVTRSRYAEVGSEVGNARTRTRAAAPRAGGAAAGRDDGARAPSLCEYTAVWQMCTARGGVVASALRSPRLKRCQRAQGSAVHRLRGISSGHAAGAVLAGAGPQSRHHHAADGSADAADQQLRGDCVRDDERAAAGAQCV